MSQFDDRPAFEERVMKWIVTAALMAVLPAMLYYGLRFLPLKKGVEEKQRRAAEGQSLLQQVEAVIRQKAEFEERVNRLSADQAKLDQILPPPKDVDELAVMTIERVFREAQLGHPRVSIMDEKGEKEFFAVTTLTVELISPLEPWLKEVASLCGTSLIFEPRGLEVRRGVSPSGEPAQKSNIQLSLETYSLK